ncbi:Phox-like protein [Basidiobolus meristosporus CBS 931.73]|uniref:Endosomal/vacuolar adapter protein YPT35 n=1 Tax=Basidiobolus meristosporus CBS 931.73 TaxID=1314790 RepID=A0A1Y1YYS1_9FUNG|nr:Phox-like protein [Basidiobolus meristosporus CBS 931.73]|eukprot:ORY03198.1 Phox-like protein [Basidiobolus meristosporus CBS 931.73]
MTNRLCDNVQEFIDISCHVNVLLHKTSDDMIRKRSLEHLTKSRSGEGCDSDTLMNADINNLSSCLQVLELRKQVCEDIKTLNQMYSNLKDKEYTAQYATEVELTIKELEQTLNKAIEVIKNQVGTLNSGITDCLADCDFFRKPSPTNMAKEEQLLDPLTDDISPIRKTNLALSSKLSALLLMSSYKESDEESEEFFYETGNRHNHSNLSLASYQNARLDDNVSEYSTPDLSPVEANFEYENYHQSEVFAEDVTVTNPVKIGKGVGSYTAYTCITKTSRGGSITVKKRYSEFVMLRKLVIKYFKPFKKGIPKLPEKKTVGRFNPDFIEGRRKGLEYFLAYVLLHPIIGGSAIVRKWFLGQI